MSWLIGMVLAAALAADGSTQPAPSSEPTSRAVTTTAAFGVSWRIGLDDALAAAAKRDTFVLLFLCDPQSPAAEAMDQKAFASPAVVLALRDAPAVRADLTTPEGKKLAPGPGAGASGPASPSGVALRTAER